MKERKRGQEGECGKCQGCTVRKLRGNISVEIKTRYLLAIQKRIRIERYFATICGILNVHNSDRSSNVIRSSPAHIEMYKKIVRSRLFCRIADRAIHSSLSNMKCPF